MAFVRELALLILAFTLALSLCKTQASSELAADSFSSSSYPLTSQLSAVKFNKAFSVQWGPQHKEVSSDESGITIWLDKASGSGFKSLRSYSSGYFSAAIKLQAGYTAGVDTSFYLSNANVHPNDHDEIDIEFLGTIPGTPYTLQTNIFARTPKGISVTGREQGIHLWFDPTQDFHHYSILWTPSRIVFLVDDNPIRTYEKTDSSTFPSRPMTVYGSIWDASSWATDNGKYKADYKYQPFVSEYTDFIVADCTQLTAAECS